MAIEGTLDEFRLPDILQMVAQQNKTGILTIQGESTIVAVSFLGGRVVSADSLEETVEDRLGGVLVREEILSRDEFAEVVEQQRRGEGRLVDLLVDGGYLRRDEVLDSLRLQTTELLRQLLSWEHGEFKFYGNDEVSYEEGFDPISVEDLLLSSLADLEEEVAAWVAPEVEESGAEWEEAAGAADEPVAEEPALGAVIEMPGPAERPHREPRAGASSGEVQAFTPPAPREAPPAAAVAARPRRSALADWLAPAVGVALGVALVVALVIVPGSFLLPLPWQDGGRTALEAVQRQTTYAAVDRAAKTFFLIENRFPDDLDRLVELSLLAPEDRFDPASGAPLELTPRDDSYELRPATGDDLMEEVASVEAITGDFLLDPEFFDDTAGGSRQPLVLLD